MKEPKDMMKWVRRQEQSVDFKNENKSDKKDVGCPVDYYEII